jgi:hypothetical protein
MEKYQIWEKENWEWQEHGLLIKESEIKQKVFAENCNWYEIEGIAGNVKDIVERLTEAYLIAVHNDNDFAITDEDDLVEFLHNNNVEFNQINFVDDLATPENTLCYDIYNREFFNLNDVETCQVYTWWDGHNWKNEFGDDESVTVTKITVEDESVSLDEWDGNNFTCGGTGLHQRYFKIIELDDEPVENMYLLEYWSQWQGSHDTAEVLTKDELDKHIAELYNTEAE